ncbi:MAG: VOC family protein [Chloroflexota bacterium]
MLKSIRHLDYVVLFCEDLTQMKWFYHEIMGFPIHLETASWLEMRVGAMLLTLAKRATPFAGPSIPAESAAVQLAFRVAPQEVQSCYEELKAAEVEIVQPPQIINKRVWKYWKHRTLFFKDPEGNLLEIYAEIELPDNELTR